MTDDLRQQLREADPLNGEPSLSPSDIHAMRRKIVSSSGQTPHPGRHVRRAVVLAIAVACLVAAVFLGRVPVAPDAPPARAPERSEPRQLQFETPGGTRIIWVLNPDLKL